MITGDFDLQENTREAQATSKIGNSDFFIGTGNDASNFGSFMQAAEECSLSRFYGGIHYKFTVDISTEYGKRIGEYLVGKLTD